MRIGVLTGGGDAPGLNAFLRALVRAAPPGDVIQGFADAFLGLVEDRSEVLDAKSTRGWHRYGGTYLGSENRVSPFAVKGEDRSADVMRTIERHALDALVVVGGDGTLGLAARLVARYGVRVLGVPKTIDGDVPMTDATLGFATAVSVATEALDRLEATAVSHHRMIALEVMGRTSGRLALHTAVAGGANAVLLAELPFSFDEVSAFVRRRRVETRFSTVVVAEGARPAGQGERHRTPHASGAPSPFGGIAEELAGTIEKATGVESRAVVLGHVVRGAPPIAEDRILAARFAASAVEVIHASKESGVLVLRGARVELVPLDALAGRVRRVTADDPMFRTAVQMGLCLGVPEPTKELLALATS